MSAAKTSLISPKLNNFSPPPYVPAAAQAESPPDRKNITQMSTGNIYRDLADCDNRDEYLDSMADEYGISRQIVAALADLLGEDEDFDGLIEALKDAEREASNEE